MSKQHHGRGSQPKFRSHRHLVTNVIPTSDHRQFLDIGIGCMSVHNLNSTSNRHLITNVNSTSDHKHFLDIDIWFEIYFAAVQSILLHFN